MNRQRMVIIIGLVAAIAVLFGGFIPGWSQAPPLSSPDERHTGLLQHPQLGQQPAAAEICRFTAAFVWSCRRRRQQSRPMHPRGRAGHDHVSWV